MKILFLDIDGVLNRLGSTPDTRTQERAYGGTPGGGGIIGVEQQLCDKIRRIRESTQCEVVLSSSWRSKNADNEGMKYLQDELGFRFLDVTGHDSTGYRGIEVDNWLNENTLIRCPLWSACDDSFNTECPGHIVESFAIIDDERDFFATQPLFRTDPTTGITDEIADAIIKHLNTI